MNFMAREKKSDGILGEPALGPRDSTSRSIRKIGDQTDLTSPPFDDMIGPSLEVESTYSTPPPLCHMGGPSVDTRSPYSTPPPLFHMGGPSLEEGSPQAEQPVPLSPHVLCAVRHKVISGRRARGEADIRVEFNTPVKHELTEEEKEKKARRKRQNREAQHRSRLKKKSGQCMTDATLESLMKANSLLQAEVEQLKRTVENLKRIEQEHMMSGQCVRYRQGQLLASQPGFHQHTDRNADQCTPGYVGDCSDNHEDIPNAGLPDQYPTGLASGHAYSPISDSGGSPSSDHQVANMMDSQWMTTTRNLESFSVGPQANMDDPGYPEVKVEGSKGRPSCRSDPSEMANIRQHPDRNMSGWILRDDAWLNVGVNRDITDGPHDSSTSQTKDPVKQEAECRPLGQIGIPSLDNISLDQLIPANIDLSRYLSPQGN